MAEKTTEETTGGKYLTKDYLARNLKTFWDKIKDYITTQISGFAKTEDVEKALDDKANQTDLNSLTAEVNGKANISDLNNLASTIETKAEKDALTAVENGLNSKVNKVEGMGLSTNDFTQEYKDKLDNLKAASATETGLMSAEDKVKLDDLARSAVTEVDTELLETSEKPVQNKIICAELAKKADIENLLKPSDLLASNDLNYEQSSDGDIILSFMKGLKHIRIYTEDSNFIEKFNITLEDDTGDSVSFESFEEGNTQVRIPNPDGKNLPTGKIYRFYVEYLEFSDLKKYKPFILRVKRNNTNAKLLELKVFEN